MNDKHEEQQDKLTFWQMMQSVFAALIGIQSEEKREEDFKKFTPKTILLAGLILTAIFFTTVIVITRSLLAVYG